MKFLGTFIWISLQRVRQRSEESYSLGEFNTTLSTNNTFLLPCVYKISAYAVVTTLLVLNVFLLYIYVEDTTSLSLT
jgi:hypothetical protein